MNTEGFFNFAALEPIFLDTLRLFTCFVFVQVSVAVLTTDKQVVKRREWLSENRQSSLLNCMCLFGFSASVPKT